jgi:Ankyrin repeats (many copies)
VHYWTLAPIRTCTKTPAAPQDRSTGLRMEGTPRSSRPCSKQEPTRISTPTVRTPLQLAAERGSVSIVRALLAAGANPAATSAEGKTAVELAEKWAGKDVETELRRDVERFAREGDKIVTRREPRPGGVELVEVTAFSPDGSGHGAERETGHAEIVALLRNRPSAD